MRWLRWFQFRESISDANRVAEMEIPRGVEGEIRDVTVLNHGIPWPTVNFQSAGGDEPRRFHLYVNGKQVVTFGDTITFNRFRSRRPQVKFPVNPGDMVRVESVGSWNNPTNGQVYGGKVSILVSPRRGQSIRRWVAVVFPLDGILDEEREISLPTGEIFEISWAGNGSQYTNVVSNKLGLTISGREVFRFGDRNAFRPFDRGAIPIFHSIFPEDRVRVRWGNDFTLYDSMEKIFILGFLVAEGTGFPSGRREQARTFEIEKAKRSATARIAGRLNYYGFLSVPSGVSVPEIFDSPDAGSSASIPVRVTNLGEEFYPITARHFLRSRDPDFSVPIDKIEIERGDQGSTYDSVSDLVLCTTIFETDAGRER